MRGAGFVQQDGAVNKAYYEAQPSSIHRPGIRRCRVSQSYSTFSEYCRCIARKSRFTSKPRDVSGLPHLCSLCN